MGARGGSQSARGGGTQGSLSSGVPACGLKVSAFLVARARAPLPPSLSFHTQKVVRKDNVRSPSESWAELDFTAVKRASYLEGWACPGIWPQPSGSRPRSLRGCARRPRPPPTRKWLRAARVSEPVRRVDCPESAAGAPRGEGRGMIARCVGGIRPSRNQGT